VRGSETILYAEAPAQATLLARRGFDAVGHYGRGDIFSLSLHGVPIPLEINAPMSMSSMGDHIWKPTECLNLGEVKEKNI
jgi:hypothetical protein